MPENQNSPGGTLRFPYRVAFLILMAVEVFVKPAVKLDLSYNSPINIILKDGIS
jgi:hypothetical protein